MVRPLPRENGFAAEYDLTDCFVALYAGNIGLVQGLDAVVEAAGLLENDPEICFVFVGDGAGREALVERADAGLCVPAENPSELAKAVLPLKQDPDLRERLGRNGRIWAERHHSPQSAAAQFETILLAARSSKKAV